jgi:serine/threonine protein kinase
MSRPISLESARPPASGPGQTISGTRRAVGFGKYRLFARLGSGGMADVYLAVAQGPMNVNRLLVIKRLREEHINDATTRSMFLAEARLAARLNHPNVIQTFEAGNENGSFFLAMEYVDGQPLSRVLTTLKRQNRILEPRLAARICSDALNGLHYAHELTDFDGSALEIVHRDVSPQNVMLTYEGMVKIVDFGIAKAAGSAQTAHGVFKGKVAFMAPEQVRAEDVDRRADLFAAGIILWESVTGKYLMAESTPAATLYNLMTKAIPRASEVNPNVPKELDDIIDRALRRDVTERYQTAKEMRDDLEAFVVAAGGVRHEELGDLAKSLFADIRGKVEEQIRTQLATLSLARSAESLRLPSHDASETQIRSMTTGLVALDDGYVEASSKASVYRVLTAHQAPVPSTRRLALVAWFFIPLLALAITSIVVLRGQRAPAHEPAAAIAPSAPTPTATATTTASVVSVPSAAIPSAEPPPSTAPRPTAAPPPPSPPRQSWVAPAAPRPTPPPATAQAPAVPTESVKAPSSAAAPPKTSEPAQGRTFRRDL